MKVSHVEKAEGPVRWIEVNNDDDSETETYLDLGPSEPMYRESCDDCTMHRLAPASAERIRKAADKFKL